MTRTPLNSWLALIVSSLLAVACGDGASNNYSDACYTPCRGGQGCSDEGLLEGCIGDAECRNGTCSGAVQKAGASSGSGKCEADHECPDHQACLGGECHSNCEADDDCEGDALCRRKVCRTPCGAQDEDACPDDYACQLDDGQSGTCMPVTPSDTEVEPPPGSFTVSPDRLAFSATTSEGSFEIVNDSPSEQLFTVVGLSHVGTDDSGQTESQDMDGLSWLTLEAEGASALDAGIEVSVPGNGAVTVQVRDADKAGYATYTGAIRVSSELMGDHEVSVTFSASNDGQWTGHMYFMSADFGEVGLAEWLANKHDPATTRTLGNAFIRRWTAFRDSKISQSDFEAMLTATQEGSWNWNSVKERCPTREAPDPNTACYMSNNPSGLSIYSDFLPDAPIPSGVVEFPLTMNLKAGDSATEWVGRIDSNQTLQYPGDPAVSFSFATDPNLCSGDDETCKSALVGFDVDIATGGRYPTDPSDTNCSAGSGFVQSRTPWLIDGFTGGTQLDSATELRYSYECRKRSLPFGDEMAQYAMNASYAATNPIADGATRRRKLELIDGAMIDGESLFVIFRETMPSFFDPTGDETIEGYGYFLLKRTAASVEPTDYEGSEQVDPSDPPALGSTSCQSWILATLEAAGGPGELTTVTASEVGTAVVLGATGSPGTPLPAADVHSYCVDTGRLDDDCPDGSRIEWFTGDGGNVLDQATIDGQTCQETRTCGQTFTDWLGSGMIRSDLVYACPTGGVTCTDKEFYLPDAGAPAFQPLDPVIQEAFRYKTQFRSRSGKSLGFTPGICTDDPTEVPYCYDPVAIEQIIDRVDCAVHIYTTQYDNLDTAARATLADFLVRNFSYSTEGGVVYDGFERLYAELLVMLGDEAYTSAFSSRFDLAGQAVKTFEGTLFEPGGIDLSGAAGFEMFKLYQAGQYYQAALDRFYGQAVAIRNSLTNLPAGEGFITQATAVSYFDRLLRASSQKSRAWSEVSRRYQSFHEPDLARLASRRAYSATYLESVILSGVLDTLVTVADAADRAQLVFQIGQAQLNFSAAMLDMRSIHDQIQDDETIFGFAPEYVPFPALDMSDTNAFEKAFEQAQSSLMAAAEKEQAALEDTRSYDVNQAVFQDTLQKIQLDADSQLSEICGSFEVDGMVYPAVRRNAPLSDDLLRIGDPCGFVGNGQLHDAILALDGAQLDLVSLQRRRANLDERILDTDRRAQEQCDRIGDFAEWRIEINTEEVTIEQRIESAKLAIDSAAEAFQAASEVAGYLKCNIGTSTDCGGAAAAGGAFAAAYTTYTAGKGAYEAVIAATQTELSSIEPDIITTEADNECESVRIDTKFEVAELMRGYTELQIDALKAELGIKLAVAGILKLHNDALAIAAEQDQATSAATDIAAAWADPNVRIYKNDVILAADKTFRQAVIDAYRATKVFEYYTAQSYAPMGELFLIRMVEAGSFPLDEYLRELEQAFLDFEQDFGNPDTRVMVLSLRDDILDIPRLAEDNTAYTQGERKALLEAALADTKYRDTSGRLSFPFRTALERLSPRTLNHKILRVEAEMMPQLGDSIARVYLVQRGTGVVKAPGDELRYVSLPERTAVLDVFFEGNRILDDSVYQSERLRDRPVVNAEWLLQFDPVNESDNRDVDLGSLDDIRLYVYYTDFTQQ